MKYPIRHDKSVPMGNKFNGVMVVICIVFCAAVVVIGYSVLEYRSSSTGQTDVIKFAPIFVSLLVAMVSTYLASNALLEQRKAREAGTDPVLVAHLGQREDARELVTFNVSNIG